jgi:hypothetical protein
MTETKATTITKEEAKAAREAIRAYRQAERDAKAARAERRKEREEEVARHMQAEDDAQSRIDAYGTDLAKIIENENMLRGQISALRVQQNGYAVSHQKCGAVLDKAYADRQAARAALKTLRAEIRGDTAEEA